MYMQNQRERENMAAMMSKPDFRNPLQFINDVVAWICPVCFEYVLCKNYLELYVHRIQNKPVHCLHVYIIPSHPFAITFTILDY